MNLEDLHENFLRLEAILDLDPNPWMMRDETCSLHRLGLCPECVQREQALGVEA